MKKKKILKKVNDIWTNLSTRILLEIFMFIFHICKIE